MRRHSQKLFQTRARLDEKKNNNKRMRRHSPKLFQTRARLDQKKNFFPVKKIVGNCSDFRANVVDAATIGSFKRRLVNRRHSLVTSRRGLLTIYRLQVSKLRNQ